MPLTTPPFGNTLVISDLHLGEDLSPTATLATRLNLEIVERQLLQFLRHYTRRREDGRPWRLVINGDLIDFHSIENSKGAGGKLGPGLGRSVENAVWAVEQVAERHADVFRALARFLARGNRVEMVSGNHDAELTWPEVQEAMRSAVARAWRALPDAKRPDGPDGDDVASGLGFHPWFFRDGDTLWIEHGHQYDDCCSLEHQLDPRGPEGDAIAVNMDVAGTRCFSNRVEEAPPRDHEGWSGLGYLRYGARLGIKGCASIVKAYLCFDAEMVRTWRAERAARKRGGDERPINHRARLEALAGRHQMDPADLLALDNMRKQPVSQSLRRLANVLMLDRIVFAGLGLIGVLLALTLLASPYSLLCALAALVASGLATHWAAGGRQIDPADSLKNAAKGILERVPVRYVVMGHTHEPVADAMDNEGRMYINTGTWVPSGRPGILRAFTHLVVRQRESGPVAELCQWRDGRSRAFTPGWKPAVLGGSMPAALDVAPATTKVAKLAEVAAGSKVVKLAEAAAAKAKAKAPAAAGASGSGAAEPVAARSPQAPRRKD